MGIPLVIRASFLLSGMIGLKVGFTDDSGIQKVIETSVPFNITNDNQTTLVNNVVGSYDQTKNLKDIQENYEKTARKLDFEEQYNFAKDGNCGPGRCNDSETCVTWVKEQTLSYLGRKRRNRESPKMYHECLPKGVEDYNKLDPSGVKLCEEGQTHSIIFNSQPCLRNDPPCPLVWKYKCVKPSENKNAHSCKLKMCPSSCIELIECGIEPPCFRKAVCFNAAEGRVEN